LSGVWFCGVMHMEGTCDGLWFRLVSSVIVCTVNSWVQTLISNTTGNCICSILYLLKYKGGSDVKFTSYIMGAFACGSDTIPAGLPIWLEGF